MFISDTAIKRPILTVVAMLGIVVFGIAALTQLDTDEYPEINAPVVVISIPVSRGISRHRRAGGHRADRRGHRRHQWRR